MADRSGQQLGNYRLIRLVGRGGFAEVYLGEHIYLSTPVAVKVLHTQLDSEDMTSFLNEARTIARLIHPNIIRVTDFGINGETPFLVMDFAPNGTLRQRHVRGTKLALTTIVPYVKQLADALQHAHDERLIHRDIKPENMLLGRKNEVLLGDFGIATIAHRTATQNTQMIAGTALYMAPELFRGRAYPSSDQYSLGVVVYEWICGESPFSSGDFIQLGYQHTYVPPQPLSEKLPTISRDVEQVVMTALAKEPKQRFGSVQAFANALAQASQSEQPFIVKPQSQSSESSSQPASFRPFEEIVQVSSFPTPPPVSLSEANAHNSEGQVFSDGRPVTEPPHEKRPVSENRPVISDAQPVTEPPEAKQAGSGSNVWAIGRRQIVPMFVGTLLFAVVSHLLIIGGNIQGGYFFALLPAIIIPLFFAVLFGPWVGLFIGVAGFLIGNYFPGPELNIADDNVLTAGYFQGITLEDILSTGLGGFIAGLTLLSTKGRYNSVRNIIIADAIGALSIFLGFSLIGLVRADLNFFIVSEALPDIIFSLILLPVFLLAYGRFISRRKRA
jgi:serine/threonine protein kinase